MRRVHYALSQNQFLALFWVRETNKFIEIWQNWQNFQKLVVVLLSINSKGAGCVETRKCLKKLKCYHSKSRSTAKKFCKFLAAAALKAGWYSIIHAIIGNPMSLKNLYVAM